MTPTDALESILSGGAVESRAVLAAMAGHGFTAKQSRRARESLAVEVQRVGFGPKMVSTWRLLGDANSAGNEASPVVPMRATDPDCSGMLGIAQVRSSAERARGRSQRAVPRTGAFEKNIAARAPGAQVRNSVRAEVPVADAGMTADEQRRTARRVVLFVERGADLDAARLTALALVQRDRTKPQQWGSCIECQNYVRRQCPADPRVIGELHECWWRRHDAP